MSKEIVDIRAKIANELAQVKETVAPPSGFNISLKNKKFTLPDGASSDGPMRCVVLDYRSMNLYYTGVYNANDPKPPTCFALGRKLDELKPSDNAPEPNAENCNECSYNQWKSDPQGGNGKACKNTRRLAVIAEDADETTKPMILTVSPSGIKSFDGFVTALEKKGVIPMQVAVDVSFDDSVTYPKLEFDEFSTTMHGKDEFFWAKREEAQDLLDREPEVKS